MGQLEDAGEEFLNQMREYQQKGVVFHALKKKPLYCVNTVDGDGCELIRLSGGKTARATKNGFVKGLTRLDHNHGRLPIQDFISAHQVIRATYAEAPSLAISSDRSDLIDVSDDSRAVDVLCDYIADIRVDKSGGAPKLFKPALLAVVLEAIVSGDLTENKIIFEDFLLLFLKKLEQLGTPAATQQAVYAFCYLGNEPFWRLCFNDPADADVTFDNCSAKLLSEHVKYAILRTPFWRALQKSENCTRVLRQLQEKWWPHKGSSVKIDERLLEKAVTQTIRPLLIDQGQLSDPKSEGYHHQKVIPRAQAALEQSSLEGDPKTVVTTAIKVSDNLLSPQEKVFARKFLEDCDEQECRKEFIELLYGNEDLEQRIKSFLEWSKYRTLPSGDKSGFNPTSVSYLLAVSNPKRYAFCKPNVYKAAAKALLGAEQVEKDAVRRIIHTTKFYSQALNLFQTVHHLPFHDLMHSHIAFFKVLNSLDHPDWDQLKMKSTDHEVSSLNRILFGPPGTGKTYHTITHAVQISDGSVPEDRDSLVARFKQLQNEGQIAFVTFHQSYGYEDFVEGIRPVLINDGEGDEAETSEAIQYECCSGVFKRLCASAASRASKSSGPQEIDLTAVKLWKMSLGNTLNPEDVEIYDYCIEQNLIRLGYGGQRDFTDCNDRNSVFEKIRSDKSDTKLTDYNVQAVNCFKNHMQIGDIVIVSDGNYNFRAIGKVSGDYKFLESDSGYNQVRPVEWLRVYEESLPRERIMHKNFSQMTIYQLKPKVLKLDALRSLLNEQGDALARNYVLIVDEINRGNISKILGELITLIEPDKRLGAKNELQVVLPYSKEPFGVPANLYIIGTMNTADRSIAFMDTALRRRFDFIEMMPDLEVIRDHVGDQGRLGTVDVAELLRVMNERIELLFDRDHQLGHSYLMHASSLTELRDCFLDRVIPLLQEYFYSDWRKLCLVLGCPYDSETGKLLVKNNNAPLISARSLKSSTLPGSDTEEIDDQLRCEVSREFITANEDELSPFFLGITTTAGPATGVDEQQT